MNPELIIAKTLSEAEDGIWSVTQVAQGKNALLEITTLLMQKDQELTSALDLISELFLEMSHRNSEDPLLDRIITFFEKRTEV